MREHTTLDTGWQMMESLTDRRPYMLKELSTSIQGCPYEIHLRITLSEQELVAMGYDVLEEDKIAYDLGLTAPMKEMDMQSVMWDRIHHVKKIMENNETDSWRVGDWDMACPFLFELDSPYDFDEEKMQEERDTWV